MYALLGVGALVAGAAILSAKNYDEKPGGRDDMYYRSRSILLSSSITKSVDAIANLDARDNARLYLNGLSAQLANSLNDECKSLLASQNNEKNVNKGVKAIQRKITSLLTTMEKLRFLSESELIKVASTHPMRVGDSPDGVSGVEGTEKWLLGGMKAEMEKHKQLDAQTSTKIKSCMTPGKCRAEKAKNVVLYKILERIPTPHFATRFPFEDALLALEHIDNKLVEFESANGGGDAMVGGGTVPTTISDMHDYVVSIARNINA